MKKIKEKKRQVEVEFIGSKKALKVGDAAVEIIKASSRLKKAAKNFNTVWKAYRDSYQVRKKSKIL